MAPSAFIMPAATASPSSIPGATGTPSPRIEPWTSQDTAARVSQAGLLHGYAVGSRPLAGSGSSYSCGGQLWKATRGFFDCGITEDMVKAQWGPGVMQLDRVWEMWVRLPPSLCWTQRRGWNLRSTVLMA